MKLLITTAQVAATNQEEFFARLEPTIIKTPLRLALTAGLAHQASIVFSRRCLTPVLPVPF